MRVLVTRPEPGASATAQRLRQRGHEPLLLPRMRIVPVLPFAEVDLDRVGLIVATSANAIRNAPAQVIRLGRSIALHAVGSATAEAARLLGFESVTDVDGDAADLADAVVQLSPPGDILYLAGRVRTPELEARMAAAGYRLRVIETYDTGDIDYSVEHIQTQLGGAPVDAILLHSANAARLLAPMLQNVPAIMTERTIVCCISQRVAESVQSAVPAARIAVARRPNEADLLALLGGLEI